jgi:hypothetical protein
MTSYVMVYKAMSHVTLLRMREFSPASTLVAPKKEATFRIFLLETPETYYVIKI